VALFIVAGFKLWLLRQQSAVRLHGAWCWWTNFSNDFDM